MAASTPDGRYLVLLVRDGSQIYAVVQLYEVGTLATDNLSVLNSFTAIDNLVGLLNVPNNLVVVDEVKVSGNSRYLVIYQGTNLYTQSGDAPGKFYLFDISNRTTRQIEFNVQVGMVNYEWMGASDRLLISLSPQSKKDKTLLPGGVEVLYQVLIGTIQKNFNFEAKIAAF